MLVFHKNYFSGALFLFLILVGIAGYVRDSFIRPYGGDLLVVIFLYCLLKSFFKIPVKSAILGVLVFAFVIEGLQPLSLVEGLGMEENAIASAMLGNHFDWLDLLLYTLGAGIVLLVESLRSHLAQAAS